MIGSAPIGIFSQQVAKTSGASIVIAAAHRQFRLDLAKSIGSAYIFLSTEKEDMVKRTVELTNGNRRIES